LATDSELIGNVVSDLRRMVGVRSQPAYTRVVRWREAIPQYEPGHRERVEAARAALAPLPGLAVAGSAYDGVGVPEVIESGARAARTLLAQLLRD
jgi:oxygen-dependent protoporphyrinogen oxidase